jgi:hypothetical protein
MIAKCLNCNKDYDQETQGAICPHEVGGPNSLPPVRSWLKPAIPTHPVQTKKPVDDGARCPQVVTMRAYEVYRAVFQEQPALVTGDCRGGFAAGELIAFLYAYGFPRNEWKERVKQALEGMEQL